MVHIKLGSKIKIIKSVMLGYHKKFDNTIGVVVGIEPEKYCHILIDNYNLVITKSEIEHGYAEIVLPHKKTRKVEKQNKGA